METTLPKKSKSSRNLLMGVAIAALLCLCLTSSAAIFLAGSYLLGEDSTGSAAPSAPKSTLLFKTDDFSESLNYPALAADSHGGVHLFWQENTSGILFHMQKERQGKWTDKEKLGSFSEPIVRSTPDGRICFFGFGVPEDSEIGYNWYWSCQENNGWSEPEPVTDMYRAITELAPAFAPDGSLQFVDWGPDGFFHNDDLIFDTELHIRTLHFVIDTAGGYHVAWQNDTDSSIQYLFSNDGGSNWGPEESLATFSGNGGFQTFDLLADPKGGVHIFWIEENQILHRRRASDGTWGAPETAADSDPYPMRVISCAVDKQGFAFVFWQHYFPDTNQEGASVSRQNSDGSWDPPIWIVSARRSPDFLANQLTMTVDTEDRMHFVWVREYMPDSGPAGYGLEYASLQ